MTSATFLWVWRRFDALTFFNRVIVDATLVFILREIMIGLYQHQSPPLQLAALAFLALVLGVLRTLAIVYSPMERRLVERFKQSDTEEKKPAQHETSFGSLRRFSSPEHPSTKEINDARAAQYGRELF